MDRDFLKAVASIEKIDELDFLFDELFTPSELEDLSLRWKLLKELHAGLPQRKISEKHGISLCKITRGSKVLKNKNSVVKKLLDESQTSL